MVVVHVCMDGNRGLALAPTRRQAPCFPRCTIETPLEHQRNVAAHLLMHRQAPCFPRSTIYTPLVRQINVAAHLLAVTAQKVLLAFVASVHAGHFRPAAQTVSGCGLKEGGSISQATLAYAASLAERGRQPVKRLWGMRTLNAASSFWFWRDIRTAESTGLVFLCSVSATARKLSSHVIEKEVSFTRSISN